MGNEDYLLYLPVNDSMKLIIIRHTVRRNQKTFQQLLHSYYLFSRNVFAFETFFPIAEAFHEKYEPDGSTY